MSDQPNSPSKTTDKKIETLEKFTPEKIHKIEKIEKHEKFEKIEHKEKPEKFEHKEKPEKVEHKEKPEKWEHKEKPEKFEHKEKPEKFEHKEFGKLEHPEKVIFENDPKGIAEGGPVTNPGLPVEQRMAALEQAVASLHHFITAQQRPDLSRGALAGEPTAKKPGG
ncbi:MAG: hypothetical protein KGJ41_00165 [Rhodospirillales bacterium]|nr:hypothetical protein [Rhodospirillales bacterium]MDE2197404.1 hypothetical protein [Rhodospirillales bacterium]MDE2575551.1 hypothetical protein [Rhodospirillales bacterium]